MIVKNIEQRIKVNKMISIATICFAIMIVIAGFVFLTNWYKIQENQFI
jgi:hypothetical protein